MKTLKYLFFYTAMVIVSSFAFIACEEDAKPTVPTATAPTSVTAVQINAASDVSFPIVVPGGYKSAAVTATGGTAVIKTQPAEGDKEGTVIATFTAASTAQAGSVVLTVTDKSNQSTTATAVMNVSISAPPSVALDKTEAIAKPGESVAIVATVTAANGMKTLTIVGSTSDPASPISTDELTQNVNIIVSATATEGQTISVSFTATDNQDLTSTPAVLTITVQKYTVVETNITTNTTWTSNNFYLLKGNVFVTNNAELTIEPGTKIFGDKVSKGALIIERGSKIFANGTAEAPVVFTSNAPKGFRNYGDWGGVVVLGKASNNQNANQSIEGITAGDFGKYGGTDDADNSGVIKYVRIEFAGIALSTDNELNGLTLGSVGSATEIHHVQVSYSGDDSYEWFGGTVNATHLIAFRGWDDDFDTDFGYRGNVQFAVSYRDPDNADKSGSNGFESDNDAAGDDKTPLTAPKFSNVSWFGPGVFARLSSGALNKSNYNQNYQFGAHLRRNSAIQIYNSVFIGSYLDGVHFDKANTALVFKGNYMGRIGANVTGSFMKQTTGNCAACGGENSQANFTTDNRFATGANGTSTVDLSTDFAGMTATNLSINGVPPVSLLAGTSPLLTAGVTVPAGLTATPYVGAFNATDNWAAASWTNYDPKNTEY
jgi:hypothetical protein